MLITKQLYEQTSKAILRGTILTPSLFFSFYIENVYHQGHSTGVNCDPSSRIHFFWLRGFQQQNYIKKVCWQASRIRYFGTYCGLSQLYEWYLFLAVHKCSVNHLDPFALVYSMLPFLILSHDRYSKPVAHIHFAAKRFLQCAQRRNHRQTQTRAQTSQHYWQ